MRAGSASPSRCAALLAQREWAATARSHSVPVASCLAPPVPRTSAVFCSSISVNGATGAVVNRRPRDGAWRVGYGSVVDAPADRGEHPPVGIPS